ncbi:hypothetical protein LTR62_003386 [Meristemomyces frigidus]|uniref:Mannan endo-1,6-alpha-mannosidase n=1 Tax=Meristemomyces frigidus TaxID=1508187 RepID=A0AAN7TG99_9PEZI|nr:hypothetical protein LTR62_003386 [Meristemomyces frigidus]
MLILAVATALLAPTVTCLALNVTNTTSIRQAATTLAQGLFAYHNPASTIGQFTLPEPWYWWLSGSAWTALIDYTAYTNDTAYIPAIHSALSQNLGPDNDFVPASQAGWEANDDQVYWVYAALTALEYNFPALPCDSTNSSCQTTSWLAVATNAFEDFVTRWSNNSLTCAGGLKWQYNPSATGNGWNYKNSVSNGGFFQLSSRLARYTGNTTYADWADKIWNWSADIGLISPSFHVFDGTSDADGANCSSLNHEEWSYNLAAYLHGAANMYAYNVNITSATPSHNTNIVTDFWESAAHSFITTANSTFFSPFPNATGIMYEPQCEPKGICNTDQTSFKGSLAGWMAKSAVLVPSLRADVTGLLRTSASGAVEACSGLGNGSCGTKWYVGGYDGATGLGQELGGLDVVLGLLAGEAPGLQFG